MHEYSVARRLLERVDVEVRSRGATGVRRLWIRVGELSGVDVELLRTAYAVCRCGTSCDAAPCEVTWVPASWTCAACGAAVPDSGPRRCRTCGAPARLAAGDELMLERIELEVDDV
jgi:hydrogenase nickel incorporation protein HypA/HybF